MTISGIKLIHVQKIVVSRVSKFQRSQVVKPEAYDLIETFIPKT
jgi:hypothetical protein